LVDYWQIIRIFLWNSGIGKNLIFSTIDNFLICDESRIFWQMMIYLRSVLMQDMAVLMTMHPSDVVKDGSTEELQALVSPFKVMNTARTTLFLVIFC
jgi:hypothetical protein